MRIRTRLPITVAAAVLGLGVALAAQPPTPPSPPSRSLTSNTPGALILERVLVIVNGEIVTQTDLEEAQVGALRGRALPQTEAELRQVVQQLTPELVANIVDNLLLLQRGREMGYELTDEQFDEVVESLKVDNNVDDEGLVAGLAAEGMTMADLRETLEQQMLVGNVRSVEVDQRISMNDYEAQEYYEANIDEFIPPVTVTLREILIAVPEGAEIGAASEESARVRAEAVHARATAGEDVAALAAEVSDAVSKTNGGLIGPIVIGDLADTVRARIEGLEVGEVGAIERTNAGYYMLQLASRTEPEPTPFDEVRTEIIDSVFESRRQVALEEYLVKLREQAIIEWKDQVLKEVYDQHLANRAASLGL